MPREVLPKLLLATVAGEGGISRGLGLDRCDSDACCNRDVTVVKLAENVPQGCRTKKPTPRTSVCVSR